MKKLTNEEFKKIYEDHLHFIKQDCENWKDMRANFEGCSFEDLHFDSDHLLYLAGANFKNANLKGINFKRANLSDANFKNANLEGICLEHADLTNANFQSAYLANANLSNCSRGNNANFQCAYLVNADLSRSFFCNSKFEYARLNNTNLSVSCFENSNFDGAILRDSNINRVEFDNSNFVGTIFDNVKGEFTRFYNSNLCNAAFTGVDIEHGLFAYAYIRHTNFTKSNLQDVSFHNAYLRSAKFYKTNIENADIRYAHLDTIEFDDCNMAYTDFEGANIINNIFTDKKSNIVNGKNIEYMKGKILTDNIIGYKKCRRMVGTRMSVCNYINLPPSASKENEVIVTLEIPRSAIVFSINGHKCRTNKAKVIAIDGADKAISLNHRTSYYVGDEFTIYNFNCVYNRECGEGIHFFLTREEAEKYIY